jgi:pimeloyl-ACP methyl ester carboxylesterase
MRCASLLLLFCIFAPFRVGSESARIALAPCHLEDLAEEVQCGQLTVFEDRIGQRGRQIQLHLAVLPAVRRAVRPDPLFIMAGGPGQGARSYAGPIARSFRKVRQTRDIVFVDLRGTGASEPLTCPAPDNELRTLEQWFTDRASNESIEEQIAECVAALSGDARHFTHVNALADLDDVRQALGYRQINLWGGSWGTRAALLYAMKYSTTVRSVILDGAVPPSIEFPESASVDAERALEALLADCERDEACRQAFPNTRDVIDSLLKPFDTGAVPISVRHPRSNERLSIRLTRPAVVEILRASLYSPVTASRLPALVSQATAGDYSPLLAQWLEIAAATTETMSLGATLSILCSEDIAIAPPREHAVAAATFRNGYAEFWRSRCRTWPTGPPLPAPTSAPLAIPALILSGELDPVTPPRWGEAMAETFPYHKHVIAPGAAHNVSFSGCVPDLIAEFLETGAPDRLDATCATRITRPPFAVSSAGTRP